MAIRKKNIDNSQPMIPESVADAELWEKFKAGNRKCFALLYNRHAASLYRYGTKLTPYSNEIEDCIHDLFVELWERRDHLGTLFPSGANQG